MIFEVKPVSLHRTAPFLRLYTLLPHRLLNGATAAVTRARRPRAFVKATIDAWVRIHHIDLADFEDRAYPSIDDFFLRRLRPGARPIGAGLVSPADGVLVDQGTIALQTPLRVKEQSISVERLVDARGRGRSLADYEGGAYAVVFLTPHGYHRVHMPWTATLAEVHPIPGRFFPQNDDALRHIPRIYERNERAVIRCLPRGGGEVLLVMVGASLVGGIHVEGVGREVEKGGEVGHFSFGSTVVILLPRAARAAPKRQRGERVKMGETLFEVAYPVT